MSSYHLIFLMNRTLSLSSVQNVTFVCVRRSSCIGGHINLKTILMLCRKKFYVGFALKERLVQCYSLAGIASFAGILLYHYGPSILATCQSYKCSFLSHVVQFLL